MSAARLDEFSSVKSIENNHEILQERTRILEMVSHKAKEKTLTLQETTDLYAKFNSTFEAGFQTKKASQQDDESWALKLLEEAENESEEDSGLATRINGIPLNEQSNTNFAQPAPLPLAINNKIELSLLKTGEQPAFNKKQCHEDRSRMMDSFIYNQFSLGRNFDSPSPHRKTHQSVFVIMFLSTLISMAAIVGSSWFL